MTNIAFHPSDEMLASYAAGEIEGGLAVMISAHLEFCPHCRAKLAKYEEQYAAQAFVSAAPDNHGDINLDDMLEQIMANDLPPETSLDTLLNAPVDTHIEVASQQFSLPQILHGQQQEIGPWSRLPGKIQRAKVSSASSSKMNLIYMDESSALPEHTHQGNEITLVLAGSFSDEAGTYHPGDFVIQDSQHRHSPRTEAGKDCLCLTLLDAPLHFTSGFASLLNPFSQLFFR